MVEWEFKRLDPNSVTFTRLDGELEKLKADYTKVLRMALESKVSSPSFSKYPVRGSLGTPDSHKMFAGNIEYGFCQALHMEEAAVASFRSIYKRPGRQRAILGIVAGNPEIFTGPCGNCRDILLDEFNPNLEIVSGSPTGGTAIVSTLGDFLFDRFKKIPRQNALTLAPDGFITKVWDTLREGERLTFDGCSPDNIHPERRYYASISTKRNIYFGGLDLMCDDHPIYPLRDAIRSARRTHDADINYVIVLGKNPSNNPPHVMYKDRQHLFELNCQQEMLLGRQQNPKVYLVSQKERGGIGNVWQTSVKEWLPCPFSARNFGDEFVKNLTQYYQNKNNSKPPQLFWRIN